MAQVTFTGQGPKVPQVNTVTPTNIASTNLFNVTVAGNKVLTFTASGTSAGSVTAGIVALAAASAVPEITELTFADQSTYVQITGPTDGTPFTQTSSASGGTASFTTATLTNGSGPNYANVGANYLGGSLPATTGDDLIVSAQAPAIKYGLNMLGYTLNNLIIPQGYSGQGSGFGLPAINAHGYPEYRSRYWQMPHNNLSYGNGNGQGNGRGFLDAGPNATTGVIYNTGGTLEQGVASLNIIGTGANTFEVLNGSVNFGPLPTDAVTITTLNNINGTVHVGVGATLTTANNDGGAVTIDCAGTTAYCEAGTITINGIGAWTTLTAFRSGAIVYNSSGTVATANLKYGGTIDTSQDIRTKTFTSTAFTAGGTLLLSSNPITQTNKPTYTDCRTISAT